MELYIHYGSTNFDPSYFAQVTNRDTLRVKPDGGLWASRVDAKYGLRDWEFYPDFEQMVTDGWDAIELHLSDTDISWGNDSLHFRLYGWDCDSILIMNPKIISPVTHI